MRLGGHVVRLFTSTMDLSIVFLEGQRARDSCVGLGIGIMDCRPEPVSGES
jgi:hypothetical protein